MLPVRTSAGSDRAASAVDSRSTKVLYSVSASTAAQPGTPRFQPRILLRSSMRSPVYPDRSRGLRMTSQPAGEDRHFAAVGLSPGGWGSEEQKAQVAVTAQRREIDEHGR